MHRSRSNAPETEISVHGKQAAAGSVLFCLLDHRAADGLKWITKHLCFKQIVFNSQPLEQEYLWLWNLWTIHPLGKLRQRGHQRVAVSSTDVFLPCKYCNYCCGSYFLSDLDASSFPRSVSLAALVSGASVEHSSPNKYFSSVGTCEESLFLLLIIGFRFQSTIDQVQIEMEMVGLKSAIF